MTKMTKKRYFPFSQYLKQNFGFRVHKVSIDAGFTCPNIDGTKGVGGCTYCNNEGFSHNTRASKPPISEQIEKGMGFMRKRFKANKFMAYFQAYTNTFAPVRQLKSIYDEILPYEDFVAMSVATRPDSISADALNLLETYSDRYEVWVEYGLQTSHNHSLERINRCDTYETFLWAMDITSNRNIKICVHVMLGLPGETYDDMMQTAQRIASLPFHSIKIHLLHVMKDTALEKDYHDGKLKMFTMDEYVKTACDFLEHIPADISVQRLTADAPPHILVAPQWCLERKLIYQKIDDELERRNSGQGSRFQDSLRNDQSWRPEGKPSLHQPAEKMEQIGSLI